MARKSLSSSSGGIEDALLLSMVPAEKTVVGCTVGGGWIGFVL